MKIVSYGACWGLGLKSSRMVRVGLLLLHMWVRVGLLLHSLGAYWGRRYTCGCVLGLPLHSIGAYWGCRFTAGCVLGLPLHSWVRGGAAVTQPRFWCGFRYTASVFGGAAVTQSRCVLAAAIFGRCRTLLHTSCGCCRGLSDTSWFTVLAVFLCSQLVCSSPTLNPTPKPYTPKPSQLGALHPP